MTSDHGPLSVIQGRLSNAMAEESRLEERLERIQREHGSLEDRLERYRDRRRAYDALREPRPTADRLGRREPDRKHLV